MKSTSEAMAEIIMFVIIISFLLAIGLGVAWFRCHAEWGESGAPVKWGVIGGCKLEVKAGQWIPAEKYRAVEP